MASSNENSPSILFPFYSDFAPKASEAPVDPAEALKIALAALVAAAAEYAASDAGRTTRSFKADGYRVQFMGEQLSSVISM